MRLRQRRPRAVITSRTLALRQRRHLAVALASRPTPLWDSLQTWDRLASADSSAIRAALSVTPRTAALLQSLATRFSSYEAASGTFMHGYRQFNPLRKRPTRIAHCRQPHEA